MKQHKIRLDRNEVFALLCSLVAEQLISSRHNGFNAAASRAWNRDTPLGEAGMEMDSIELMQAASAVDEFFHLHETGVEEYLLRHRSLGAWCDIVLQAFPNGHRHLTFRTSGSQGVAKVHQHRAAALLEETSALARLFPGRSRVVTLVAPHHIYGLLFSVLLPQALQLPVLDARNWTAGKILRNLQTGDLVIGFPLLWQALLRYGHRFPDDVFGVTSTAPCDAGLIIALGQAGLARMTEIYGSSETAGIGYRHDPSRAYRLFSHWDKVPLGRKSPPDYGLKRNGQKSILPPDLLDWRSARTFRHLGRRDMAVQVAGVNVYPDEIAQRLQDHPGITACAVRLMRADEGDRLKAYIVLPSRHRSATAKRELEQWIFSQFKAAERPVSLTYGLALPITKLGKLTDW